MNTNSYSARRRLPAALSAHSDRRGASMAYARSVVSGVACLLAAAFPISVLLKSPHARAGTERVAENLATHGILRQFNVRVPMSDDVTLSADIYRPATVERLPVVLVRTPYTKDTARFAERGEWWAEHGYAFVVQDVRGRGDSDGIFYPLINEAKDGFDTLAWIAAQPWSSGSVGMLGSSYVGWTQMYAAISRSPYLKAIVPAVAPPDPDRNFPASFGIMDLSSAAWLAGIDGHSQQDLSSLDLAAVYSSLPVSSLDGKLGRVLPAWHDWVAHRAHDSYWELQSYQRKLLSANVPALHITGWYDEVQAGTTENFVNLTTQASSAALRRQQRLIIGPWPHDINAHRQLGAVDFGSGAIVDLGGLELSWFDHWLKGIDNDVDTEARVRLFVMGSNRWIDENEWPIGRTVYQKYYMHSGGHANTRLGDGALSRAAPAAESADHFRYDPSDPVPFLGLLNTLNREPSDDEGPGPDDYRNVELRPDVLVYTSQPMTEPTLICGPLRVRLYGATSATDTDWTARVLDVLPEGFARRLNDGIVRARFRHGNEREERLVPGKPYEFDINVGSTCMQFEKYHRVRLEISSSAFPRYERNLNTGGPLGSETKQVVAQQ